MKNTDSYLQLTSLRICLHKWEDHKLVLRYRRSSAFLPPIFSFQDFRIRPLRDMVTWYGMNYTGTQIAQWDFQNKGKSGWTGKSSFVVEVPLHYLHPSVIYSVPCDRILQRAFCNLIGKTTPPPHPPSPLIILYRA